MINIKLECLFEAIKLGLNLKAYHCVQIIYIRWNINIYIRWNIYTMRFCVD